MTRTLKKSSLPLQEIRSDYEIGKSNGRFRRPRKGVSGVGTNADYHFRSESEYLYHIEYARDLDRNDMIAGMVIDRLLDNVLQETGIRPDPDTGSEDANARLKDLWLEWSDNPQNCDLSGVRTFTEMERSVLRAMWVDGDHFALPTDEDSIELIEAHRCRTPGNTKRNVIFGVELDQRRRRLNYVFTKDEIEPHKTLSRVSDTVFVQALDQDGSPNVFHICDPHRISQTRGISVFRRVADPLGMHDDIEFANLVRQQVASCFGIIRKQSKTPPVPGGSGNGYGARWNEQVSSDFTRTLENIGPGMQIRTLPGEDIEAFSADIPNPQFFEHVSLILKIVAANLGIPLQAVLLDASQTNFSGWRGAIDQARAGFRRIQTHLISRFHQPVWRWKVANWLQSDRLLQQYLNVESTKPFKNRWHRPTWEYIEPAKDTTADLGKKSGLITSPRRISARRGEDREEIDREIVEDNVRLIRMARDQARLLNSEREQSEPVFTWREILVLPIPDGLTAALGQAASETPAPRGDDDE